MHDVTLTFNPASCLYTTSIWENTQILIQMAYVLIFASLDISSDLPPVGAAQYNRGYRYHGHAHNLNYFCATPLFLSSPLPLTNAWTWHCTLILCLCHYCLSFSFGVDHHQSFSRDIPWLKFLFWFWRKTVSYYIPSFWIYVNLPDTALHCYKFCMQRILILCTKLYTPLAGLMGACTTP